MVLLIAAIYGYYAYQDQDYLNDLKDEQHKSEHEEIKLLTLQK